jgi:hypothetical protein
MSCLIIWFFVNVLKTNAFEGAKEVSNPLFPTFGIYSIQIPFKVDLVNDYFGVSQDLNVLGIQKSCHNKGFPST